MDVWMRRPDTQTFAKWPVSPTQGAWISLCVAAGLNFAQSSRFESHGLEEEQ